MSIIETYIQYGVPNDWAKEYEKKKISVNTFRHTSKQNLCIKYSIQKNQIDFVKSCLKRKPINNDVIQKLLLRNNFTCCLCKGIKSHSYIIHHIEEYSISQDNSYNNLALLCPNDHDEAHKEGISLTNKITKEQIRKAKKEWEKQVALQNKEKATSRKYNQKSNDWKKINPFKELQSYHESDKELFFGRKIEIQELLTKINKYGIIGLFGESGTGKTSLVNAGLIPEFRIEEFIVISIRCLDEPIKRIREEIIRIFKEDVKLNAKVEELAIIDTFPRLIVALKDILKTEELNLIIIIDQFEELFTKAREIEREFLAKGITESSVSNFSKNRIYFLLSLREDYIGEIWDWAHVYNLENAWIHQYRIKRLTKEKALEVISEPLLKLNIKVDNRFVNQLVEELKKIGDNFIYPPYLQIVCSELYEKYKFQNTTTEPLNEFGANLYNEGENAESIIADYFSESMLDGLIEEEKLIAQNILDLLTGPEGLRTFLSIEDISRYVNIKKEVTLHVIEHLIKKKIIHPVVESDIISGYELVHDFLSKKFFEKLGQEAKKSKTTIEIFRKAFREWKQHGVLASKDRLEILFNNIKQLNLNEEEWTFLLKSSFSVYYSFDNQWIGIIDQALLIKICLSLSSDKDEKIVENAIGGLGKTKNKDVVPYLINIIQNPKTTVSVKNTAISQFSWHIYDSRIMDVLKNIILTDKSAKLRKTAVYSFAKNLNEISKFDIHAIDLEINILFHALDDSMTQVRKEAADVLSYQIYSEKSVEPLITRLKKESSIHAKKAIISCLGILLRKEKQSSTIFPILQEISLDDEEDYRIREEAKNSILNYQHRLEMLLKQ